MTVSTRAAAKVAYWAALVTRFWKPVHIPIVSSAWPMLFEIGAHAGLNDTSLMLALDPRLVRADRLSAEPKLGSADGVYGDPTRSTAKLGMAGVDAIVSRTVAAINAAVAHR